LGQRSGVQLLNRSSTKKRKHKKKEQEKRTFGRQRSRHPPQRKKREGKPGTLHGNTGGVGPLSVGNQQVQSIRDKEGENRQGGGNNTQKKNARSASWQNVDGGPRPSKKAGNHTWKNLTGGEKKVKTELRNINFPVGGMKKNRKRERGARGIPPEKKNSGQGDCTFRKAKESKAALLPSEWSKAMVKYMAELRPI